VTDLTGQRFGRLTVVERAIEQERAGTGSLWLCQCDCGSTTVRPAGQLLEAKRERIASTCSECRGYELTGQRFGELTVIGRAEDTTGRSVGRLWMCECDCGRKAIRSSGQLMQSRRSGQRPCCHQCLRELRGGQWYQRLALLHERYLAQWVDHGTLYLDSQSKTIERNIRRDMAQELGFELEPEPPVELLPPHDGRGGAGAWFPRSLAESGVALECFAFRTIPTPVALVLNSGRSLLRTVHLRMDLPATVSDRCVDLASASAGGTPGAASAVHEQYWEHRKRKELAAELAKRSREPWRPKSSAKWWPIDVEAAKERHAQWLEERDRMPPVPARRNWFAWLAMGPEPDAR
jgi:hypothetical protein